MVLTEYNERNAMRIQKRDAREEGIAIGEERGISIGEARGLSIGEARGIAIGEARGRADERLKTTKEAAINFAQFNLTVEQIAQATGQEVDVIKEWIGME